MTGSALPHTSTIRNHGLRAAINEYMSKLKEQDDLSPGSSGGFGGSSNQRTREVCLCVLL
jgi:hypothetical protein